ncbi:MAG: response regulator [Pseudomonadota bacterium]
MGTTEAVPVSDVIPASVAQEPALEQQPNATLLEAIVSSIPQGTIGVDSSCCVTFFNPQAVELLRLSADALFVGASIFDFLPTETYTTLLPTLQGIADVSLAAATGDNVGQAATTPNTARLNVTVTAKSILVPGDTTQYVLLVEPASDEKRSDVTSEDSDADHSTRAKAGFLANISHEIRTPLSAVISFTDLLLMDHRDDAALDYVVGIKRNALSLLELLNDILDQSRLEADQVDVVLAPVSVTSMLTEVASTLRVRAQEKALVLEAVLHTAVPEFIETDRVKLRQILVNLVTNAIKFTEQGFVRLGAAFEPGHIVFSVEDSGIGIPKNQVDDLFKPFSQGKNGVALHRGGAGLGLSICTRLAQKLGGEIQVQSDVGKGSAFSLKVPIGSIEAGTFVSEIDDAQHTPLRRDASSLPRISGSVLIVDDKADVMEPIEALLTRLGASVTTAASGAEALQLITTQPTAYAAVLMDLDMPIMDGLQTLNAIREAACEVPVIAMTAHVGRQSLETLIDAGFDDFLPKPIDVDSLCNAVTRAINNDSQASLVKVLVIDDHVDSAAALAQLLRLNDCEVQVASSGVETRHVFSFFRADLCLVDIGLPDIDGAALVRELRGAVGNGQTTFVATTGDVTDSAPERFRKAGFDGFVGKPVDFDEVLAIVEGVRMAPSRNQRSKLNEQCR